MSILGRRERAGLDRNYHGKWSGDFTLVISVEPADGTTAKVCICSVTGSSSTKMMGKSALFVPDQSINEHAHTHPASSARAATTSTEWSRRSCTRASTSQAWRRPIG